MTQTTSDRSSVGTGAAGFTRPLLLTARQDLYGYLLSVLGRLLLLAITCTSIVAIILIVLFIMSPCPSSPNMGFGRCSGEPARMTAGIRRPTRRISAACR